MIPPDMPRSFCSPFLYATIILPNVGKGGFWNRSLQLEMDFAYEERELDWFCP